MTNLAEILKNAPQGLKLYSLVHGEVTLKKVIDSNDTNYPIVVVLNSDAEKFTKYGKFFKDYEDAECVLFPSKEHKSWDNWQEVLFQSGDVVSSIQLPTPYIITDIKNNKFTYTCSDNIEHSLAPNNYRYATPEEREQFTAELNANSYKWNDDTKQIEKIEQQYTPKYKVGDWIICTDTNTNDEYFYESDEIVPHKITSIKHNKYEIDDEYIEEDTKEFDATTTIRLATEQELIYAGIKEKPFTIDDFKPFDKVLVKYDTDSKWTIELFERYDKSQMDTGEYICLASSSNYCIPYNDETKHLLGTTDDCPSKYKTW